MTTNDDNRYGPNRNTWRKVYSYNKQKPKVVTFVDTATSRSLTQDLNQYYRHRDYFIIDKVMLSATSSETPAVILGEYDEGLLFFNNETEKTGSFNFTFTGAPFVVFTVEDTDNINFDDNINVFGLNTLPTSTQFFVGVSAPFSGNIRYRAVYSTTYPIQVTSSFSSSLFYVYAGQINTANATEYTASYSFTVAPTSLEYRASSFDVNGNFGNNVSLEPQIVNATDATNTISAPLTDRIHFIVAST